MENTTQDVDLSTTMFIDRRWLEHHTMNVRRHLLTGRKAFMNPSGLMDYFCQVHNPFYDQRSSNEKLRRIQPVSGPTQIDAAAQLKTMKGIEYTIDTRIPPNPHFNIIYKQNRKAEDRVTKINAYYVRNGEVYQAPSLQAVLSTRLRTAMHHITNALDTAQAAAEFSPAEGHSWTAEKVPPKLPNSDEFRADPNESNRKDLTEEHALHDASQRLLHELVGRFPVAAASMPELHHQQAGYDTAAAGIRPKQPTRF